jgi:heat shock protein HslJ
MEVMEQEAQYMKALAQVTHYELKGSRLFIYSALSMNVLLFEE